MRVEKSSLLEELRIRRYLEDQTRMTYWRSKVRNIGVPMPQTKILPFEWKDLVAIADPGVGNPEKVLEAVRREARFFGYPFFLRTDLASGKHDWKNSCFVASEDRLPRCLFGVVEANMLADINPRAVVLRQYVPLESAFTAFWGELPISKERRYFVRDGKVVCHYPYWPEDAMRFPPGKEPEGWSEKLAELNRETDDEIELLTGYAERLAAVLDGYWSLDFARGRDGVWYFIDAARGELSWHPECSYCRNKLMV